MSPCSKPGELVIKIAGLPSDFIGVLVLLFKLPEVRNGLNRCHQSG